MAYGPSFRKNYTDTLPTSNVDLVPTVLHIQGLQVPPSMDGRVMQELLNEKAILVKPVPEIVTTETSANGNTYQLQLHQTKLGKYRYVDFATIKRNSDSSETK